MVPPGVMDPIAVPNNRVLAARAQRYPNTLLVDRYAACAKHPEFVERNCIHLTLQGMQAYADLIAAHLADPCDEAWWPPRIISNGFFKFPQSQARYDELLVSAQQTGVALTNAL